MHGNRSTRDNRAEPADDRHHADGDGRLHLVTDRHILDKPIQGTIFAELTEGSSDRIRLQGDGRARSPQ